MGRDAFFNTGLERRFAFRVQSSYDMQEFGGKNTSTQEYMERYGKFSHTWNAETDMPYIHMKLQKYLEDSDTVDIRF
jgi:hypothetical protein